eukprot:29783_1
MSDESQKPDPSGVSDSNNTDETKTDTDQKQTATPSKIDINALKLPLEDIDNENPKSKYPKNIPMSAPSRSRNNTNNSSKTRRQPPFSARNRNPKTENESTEKDIKKFVFKRTIPYTPRLDELPLTVRLHSNPMILVQSLRRQKISNYNMYHIEPAIDNKPSKELLKYAKRRKKIRECNDPFPNMPKLDIPNDIPLFVAKQFKYEVFQNKIRKHNQHKFRCNNMVPHIDNKLPTNIISYRKMRRNRLKNAQKRAKKIHEKRLQSPPNTNKAPPAPTRRAPPNTKKRLSQIEREKILKLKLEKEKADKENENINNDVNVDIVYINEKTARESKFIHSPKAQITRTNTQERRKTVVQALPCHFEDWNC